MDEEKPYFNVPTSGTGHVMGKPFGFGAYVIEGLDRPLPPDIPPVWIATKLFCPFCGIQGLEQREDAEDYYMGPESHCPACEKISFVK